MAVSNQELERLAELSAELDLSNSEDLARFLELVGPLTREEILELAEIHQRRAFGG